ncbi:hypothetical protein Pmani_003459 [Petrolisthes manimaculis]|uniref:Uncharacterized protein n=1 Tax=Petrolisthes manimaculis TaxID=1843537 RepID=A0AAE1QII1_9EUCA|nr:hypothetical protein Pmani_003459 [Petrolisthes manimaculis]
MQPFGEITQLDQCLAWNSKRSSLKVYVVVESSDLERSIDNSISKAECPGGMQNSPYQVIDSRLSARANITPPAALFRGRAPPGLSLAGRQLTAL